MRSFLKWSVALLLPLASLSVANAEETGKVPAEWEGSVACDAVSRYVWRGQDMGGVSLQPTLAVGYGGFSLSAWGSYGFDREDAKEFDLTLGYEAGGFSVSVSDYWVAYSDSAETCRYFQYRVHETAHVWEVRLGGDFGFVALDWFTNFAGADGVDAEGRRAYSSYLDVTCPFEWVGLSWKADVGVVPWETSYYEEVDGVSVVNVGIGATKTVACSNGYSFGISSSIVWNPTTDYAFFVVGVSL